VSSAKQLEQWLYSIIADEDRRKNLGEIAKNYIYQSAGSSRLIAFKILNKLKKLKNKILLTLTYQPFRHKTKSKNNG